VSATSFSVTGRIRGLGQRTISWTPETGFDDPLGLLDVIYRLGYPVELTPTGPRLPPADRPDLVALHTARAAFDYVTKVKVEGEVSTVEELYPSGAPDDAVF
jgi:hypothetical protein